MSVKKILSAAVLTLALGPGAAFAQGTAASAGAGAGASGGVGFNTWLAANFGITNAAIVGATVLASGALLVQVVGTDSTGQTVTTTVTTTSTN